MTIEFAFVAAANSEPGAGAAPKSFFFDPASARGALREAESAGFSSVVVDEPGGVLSNFDLAAQAARWSSSMGIALTHWAGALSPLAAARQVAALDRLSKGRIALRIASDSPAGEDGDEGRTGHVAALQRTDEYLTVLKRLWSNDKPFDHEGPFYSLRGGFVAKQNSARRIPEIRMGGRSGTALKVAGRHADIFELSPGTPAEIRVLIERVRTAASPFGRAEKIRFALPIRVSAETRAPDCERAPTPDSAEPTQIVLALLAYAEAGVSEFMVTGADSTEAIAQFDRRVGQMFRNSAARDRLLAAHAPALRDEPKVFFA